MWESIIYKLGRLKGFDPQCQAFGAENHRYLLRPCLSIGALNLVEERLGVALPTELRRFYLEVGDGVAGPHYGLKTAAELTGYHPAEEYPGVKFFRQVATAEGDPPDERGYFEVLHEHLAGLIPIIHEGCGHEICLVASGPQVGAVVYVSADGFVGETASTLPQLYIEWLDAETAKFEAVHDLMRSDKSLEQIEKQMTAQFQDHHACDRIVSIANVAKPAKMFGEGNQRILYWQTQRPWYERVLKDWRRQNG